MKIMKAVLSLAVFSSLLGLGVDAKAQTFLPVTSGTFYNNVSYADVYQFNAGTGPDSEFNGSQIAISGGQVVAWDLIDSDASAIGGASAADATTVEIGTFGSSSYTAGPPNAVYIAGGANFTSGQSGLLSYLEGTAIFDGITSYNATTFTGVFDISNNYSLNTSYAVFAEFAGMSGSSSVMIDEISSYYSDINNYVSTVDDPHGGWTFAGSYEIPDAASTFELLLAAAALAELGRRRFSHFHPGHRLG